MAEFKTHVTTGLLCGYLAGIASVALDYKIENNTPLCILAGSFIGSFLPDLDHNDGKPFSFVFNIMAISGLSIAFAYFIRSGPPSKLGWVAIPPMVGLFIRYGLGTIFKKYTSHRGIFHSIPAMLIATLSIPLALSSFHLSPIDISGISLSVGIGFLSHLILDELNSAMNFEGILIVPKSSLGTALKFFSTSRPVTVTAYFILTALIYLNHQEATGFFQGLKIWLKG
ncbi:MAG: metal-dependent hydrolase [Desulfobulbaceae bacterium]|nr:metal-dependent hydrolase [Desulfobulbaceae bacterium]